MDSKYKITIPKPCHEDWNSMTPDETGKFCGSCVKSVVDFTGMKASEIQEYFDANQGKRVCGRFRNEQVDKFNLEIPQSILRKKMSFHKAFTLALFIVMGSSLFSCKNQNNATLGEVSVVNDSVVKIKERDVMLVGEAEMSSTDFVNPPAPPKPKIDEVKFVKEPPQKDKAKRQHTKSKESYEMITTVGLVLPEKRIDSIEVEKK